MIGCRPLTDLEVNLVLQHLRSKRNKTLFILGVRTGLRISELLSLQVKDIYQNGVVLDRVFLQRRNSKGKLSSRSIVLHDQAKSYLVEYLLDSPNHSMPLFPSCRTPTKSLDRIHAYRLIRRATEDAGIVGKVATHSMRKTFAKRVYERLDKDLLKTKVALGHKSIDSTISYLSFDQAEVDQAILNI
jgi:integrase